MEPVRPVTPSTSIASLDMPLRPVAPLAGIGGPERQVLDPAVSVELSPDAASAAKDAAKDAAKNAGTDRRGFERDADTQALVFRVTDGLSGDVIVQIPNEIVLKARAYARQPEAPTGERVARTA